MLELTFTPQDLVTTRFAFSPLWDVVASIRVLKRPAEHALHRPWADQARARLTAAGLDLAPLADLVPVPTKIIPAFVCPPPTVPVPDLELELAAVRSTPPAVVRSNLKSLPPTPALHDLADDPPSGLAALADVIKSYWDLVLRPHWPRITTLYQSDVHARARKLTEGGLTSLFADLDPNIGWDGEVLTVAHRTVSRRTGLGGRGLLLVPSVFVWPRVFSISASGWQPTLRYPPRRVATLWEKESRAPSSALAAVLGPSRAQLLAELEAPASTQELAARTGLSSSGVSQHLTAMRDAGLVSAHRAGRFVLYARTSAAESLLSAAGPT
ncbi:ArsR/SmtB family transcription factor [Labedaea rhizosphaerae]|uniref:Helix-turn-helix protein n=1 Tax=Labedaea rhizosphaerae TaxID=598644 RepID=A0A4R6SLE1_LABRH|nr:metalloregulator ArsR/SmtB family transcription factor [Labedaea rhizosphaerae]TDQ05028.1 helix-turn-helix protein [Labedaea rhizosphaerae]